jgi:hypothetical protein
MVHRRIVGARPGSPSVAPPCYASTVPRQAHAVPPVGDFKFSCLALEGATHIRAWHSAPRAGAARASIQW